MKIATCWILGKRKLKISSPEWNRIVLRNRWAIQSLKFAIKMGPQNPMYPKSEFFFKASIEPLPSPYRGRGIPLPTHVIQKGSAPHSRFSRFDDTDLKDVSGHVFWGNSAVLYSPRNNISRKWFWAYSWMDLSDLADPKPRIICLY